MKSRRVEILLMLAVLLTANFFTFLWMQGNPAATAWASAMVAPAAAPAAAAAIPPKFSYQGTLRNVDGNLINGAVNLTLKLYKDVTGGSALYTETYANINVRDGLFSVVVGDTTPIAPTVFDNFPLYLGLSVNTDPELLPRQRLHPVPFAMQATTAQSAVTANNLVQGGGVAGLVSLGANGASEVGFNGGGKISGDQNGVTINAGGTAKKVTIVGDWSAGAIYELGDKSGNIIDTKAYPVSINRYVVEAKDGGTSPTSVRVNDELLLSLCQDEDGCSVTLGMRNWHSIDGNDPTSRLATMGPFHFSISPPKNNKRQWSSRNPATGNNVTTHINGSVVPSGEDGDNTINHMAQAWDCMFTDGEYVNGIGSDSAQGFNLLNWYNGDNGDYNNVNMTCVLIIED